MTEKLNHDKILFELENITLQFLKELDSPAKFQHITPSTTLDKDLHFGSLERSEFTRRIEKQFQVTLSVSDIYNAKNISDVISAISIASPDLKFVRPSLPFVSLSPIETNVFNKNSLVEILDYYGTVYSDRHHIYLQEEEGKEKVITYGQLYEKAKSVAFQLQILNINNDDTVAIMLPTSEEFFFVFMGILIVGAIPVPLYPPLKTSGILEYIKKEAVILNNAKAKILITFDEIKHFSEFLKPFTPSLSIILSAKELMHKKNDYKILPISNDHLALIQYTSGSTGEPKGVALTHGNIIKNIECMREALDLTSKDVAVSWLPLYHDMGLIGLWLGSFCIGCPVVIMSPLIFLKNPSRWLWAIHYHRGTISAGPNFAFELSANKIDDADIKGLDLSSLRHLANGAEAVKASTLMKFYNRFKQYHLQENVLKAVYGLAENSVGLCIPTDEGSIRIDVIDKKLFETKNIANPVLKETKNVLKFVSCGRVLPYHCIRVVDDKGFLLKDRQIGNVEFTGPSATQGYYENESATKELFHGNWLKTGDYGYLVENDLYITGRKKDIIIKAGRCYSPEAIEEAIWNVKGVRKGSVVAFGLNDERHSTEKIVLVAEIYDSHKKRQEDIKHDIATLFMEIMEFPVEDIVLIKQNTIPKTSSGKLRRSALKKLYLENNIKTRKSSVIKDLAILCFYKVLWNIKMLSLKTVKLFYTLYLSLISVVFLPILFLLLLLLKPSASKKIIPSCLKLFFILIFCPVHTVGAKKLTSQSLVYVSNHTSYLDGLALLTVLPHNVIFVGKEELLKSKILKIIIKKMNYLTVKRLDFSKSETYVSHMVETLKNNNALVIFSEGTFTSMSGIQPLKLGAFEVAALAKVPLCPVGIRGLRNFIPEGFSLFKPTTISVHIGDFIYPTNDTWEEALRLRTLTREALVKLTGEQAIEL